ncbi:serine/arginine repetitive matrix protein 1 [Triticum aestivum]|uniref:serine/arginine repetitive matrix protein 1 n=1 Tax=Triticum aestivum TaxID=4565 RepID=UPI001D031354|nr:serine/arginine repetitive matrix protein 1-like [Triticum aestivum]
MPRSKKESKPPARTTSSSSSRSRAVRLPQPRPSPPPRAAGATGSGRGSPGASPTAGARPAPAAARREPPLPPKPPRRSLASATPPLRRSESLSSSLGMGRLLSSAPSRIQSTSPRHAATEGQQSSGFSFVLTTPRLVQPGESFLHLHHFSLQSVHPRPPHILALRPPILFSAARLPLLLLCRRRSHLSQYKYCHSSTSAASKIGQEAWEVESKPPARTTSSSSSRSRAVRLPQPRPSPPPRAAGATGSGRGSPGASPTAGARPAPAAARREPPLPPKLPRRSLASATPPLRRSESLSSSLGMGRLLSSAPSRIQSTSPRHAATEGQVRAPLSHGHGVAAAAMECLDVVRSLFSSPNWTLDCFGFGGSPHSHPPSLMQMHAGAAPTPMATLETQTT